jgi:hypothetical protein
MADNKTIRVPQDRTRIAMGEDDAMAYWMRKFRVTRESIAEAVAAVGTSAQAVADFLNKKL